MTDKDKDSHIPSWDGQPNGWRRYTKEVAWFVSSTPVEKRRYAASKLIGRLQGPARLLAMSWQRSEFDAVDGTATFLRKLASSPLVRQTLPNTAAILQQYLSFRRRQGESMSTFLVRETLGYEEFAEALQRLWEEKQGIDPSQVNYGLPPPEDPWDWWHQEEAADAPPGFEEAVREEHAEVVDDGPTVPVANVRASAGSSPSRGTVRSATKTPSSTELSFTDSFIMGVLRGWRLLQAACLSAEETRDILSTTQNSLDFSAISKALQSLWDEQLLGYRGNSQWHSHHQRSRQLNWHEWDENGPGEDWQDWESEQDSHWFEQQWHEGHDETWPEEPPVPDVAAAVEDDEQFKEVQRAEQEAEQLLAEAKRTWAEAQRATQLMRRDRGFGKASSATSGASGQCWTCGGSHYQRDCPDLRHPPFRGKGKGANYMSEYDIAQMVVNYMKGKGKSRKGVRPQSKGAHVMDSFWSSKGKNHIGKPAGQPGRSAVNAYTTQFFDLGGIEMNPQHDLGAVEGEPAKPASQGMLDCGATASAAPDIAVQGLIKAVLSQDSSARIEIQQYMRPFFRFGNGKWGQALYRLTLQSDVSGKPRKFSLYSLPNPEDMSPKNLVPILVGMDHLGPSGCQMLVDFGSGYVIDGVDVKPSIYKLDTNNKGHYVYDVVYHLTRGFFNSEGSAVVKICEEHVHPDSLATLQFRPLEFYQSVVDYKSHDSDESRQALLWQLYHHTRGGAAFQAAQMCSTAPSSSNPDDISFRDHLRSHVEAASHAACDDKGRAGCGELHPEHQGHFKEASAAHRQDQIDQDGSTGSPGAEHMAMLRKSCGRQLAKQQMGILAPLRCVQSQIGVCPSSRCTKQLHSGCEPSDGSNHVDRAGKSHEGCTPNCSHLQGNDGQDYGRRAAGDLGAGSLEREERQEDSSKDQSNSKELRVSFSEGNESRTEPGKLGCAISRAKRPGTASDIRGEGKADGHPSRAQGSSEQSDSDDSGCSVPGGDRPAMTFSKLKDTTSLRSSTAKRSSTASTPRSLPQNVAVKVMQMVATLSMSMMAVALEINMDGKFGLWEIACADNSWLTASAIEHGIPSRRINYKQGYDIYKKATWERMSWERRQQRPKKLWFSLPCTRWCQWNQVNYNTPERKEVLETMRRRERRMLKWAADFIIEALDEDPDTDVYFEWTFPCSGWQQRPMVELEEKLHERGIAWEKCRIDGCNYGMKDHNNENFLHKKWLVRTTDELFWKNFRAKVCPRNHTHSLIQGVETSRTAYYPKRMVESIVRHWKRQLAPARHLHYLFGGHQESLEDENWERRMKSRDLQICQEAMPAEASSSSSGPAVVVVDDDDVAGDGELSAVPQKDRDAWEAKLKHYHRAAGHPSNKNLIHLFRDAGLDSWKITMAKKFKCDACESIKMGGTSSGSIPPAATHESYRPWQAVGLDCSEWLVPGQKWKIRFVLMLDLATKLRVLYVIKQYPFLEMQVESASDVIRALSERWLCDKPKPEIVIPDNAKTFKSTELREFCNSIGVQLSFPPEKESWAHGLVESAIKDVKMTATAIQKDQLTLEPAVALMLSCASLNSTEYTKGYSSFQWCYGKDYTISDEDVRSFQQLPDGGQTMSYEALVRARQDAEAVARRTKALRVMSRLKNTTVRQPLRTFHPTQLVKVWRKEWPADLYQGKRGGGKMSGKPHWIGPGRVVFHEVLPHQDETDDRRHIVWVLIGTKLMRCSVHSVRPVTDTEKMLYEIGNKEDPSQWRSITDLLPRRDYTDLTDQVPGEDEVEMPELPDAPNPSTALVPLRRAAGKQTVPPAGLVTQEERAAINRDLEDVNRYEDDAAVPVEPAEKRPRTDFAEGSFRAEIADAYDLKWLDKMHHEEESEWQHLSAVFEAEPEVFSIEFDLNLDSNRKKKQFFRNPNMFLVKKMRDSEVIFGKLSPEHRALFTRAKLKEVNSFLQNQAVRRCIDDSEIREALGSDRVLKARWVLVWKLIPPEDKEEAKKDAATNPETVHTSDGSKKAKARIVLLGYQHPELGSPDYKTSSPVQSLLARNLTYQMVCQHSWNLEGLDLATAFLQTEPTNADSRLWTTGVAELREPLNVGPEGVMKIMKNIYGSTTAPRGLWLSLNKKLCELGGKPALGERCLWIWTSSHEKDPAGHPRVIGLMGGQVDDFHRIGDPNSSEWAEVCRKINESYRWGSAMNIAMQELIFKLVEMLMEIAPFVSTSSTTLTC